MQGLRKPVFREKENFNTQLSHVCWNSFLFSDSPKGYIFLLGCPFGRKAKRLIFWVGEKTAFCAWFAKRLRFLAGLLVRATERQKLLAGEVKSIGRS